MGGAAQRSARSLVEAGGAFYLSRGPCFAAGAPREGARRASYNARMSTPGPEHAATAAAPIAAAERTHAERRAALLERFRAVRRATEALAAPLSEEDCVVQSMPDASPVKWHLAHTTWFYETFVLLPGEAGAEPYQLYHPRYGFLFNSYYETVGARVERPRRGLQTRPSAAEVRAYRAHVDAAVERWLGAELPEVPGRAGSDAPAARLLDVLELGLNHEEQHQELILTDVLHLFSCNPLEPAYAAVEPSHAREPLAPARFVPYPGGVHVIGHSGGDFAFDNEGPAHEVLLRPFELATRPVTCGEYLEFVEGGGYEEPGWWLSDGWELVRTQALRAPLYWRREPRGWTIFSLHGRRPLDPGEPVAHVSFYEADAYARFRGARLPDEAEWEVAARALGPDGAQARPSPSAALRPLPPAAGPDDAPVGLFGGVWEWTRSPYVAYPGFRPAPGALGEYNGKFMCNQMVLRGGSCVTPPGHVRATYRNFFPPAARWQFSGLRLARDA